MTGTRHVVLVTYGEPPAPAFLDQLVYSWRILLGLTRTVAPIPLPLLPAIALARAHGRRALWRRYRYTSPLEPITERQAERIGAALGAERPDRDWRVHVAYEFRRPLLTDLLLDLPAGEPAVVVPMYAAESAFTHALSRGAAAACRAQSGQPRDIRVLGAIDADAQADLSADHVLAHTSEAGWRGEKVALVLAAHGTVLDPPKPIETGLLATETLCRAIAERLAPHFGTVVNGWLNHTRGGRWTEPPIDAALARAAAAGCTRVVYYPYGFLADNAESELEGRMALESVPDMEARHLPCLNDSPRLAQLLAQRIVQGDRSGVDASGVGRHQLEGALAGGRS